MTKMSICGIKATHDGSVAIISDGELAGCIEAEKVANNPRYSSFDSFDQIRELVAELGHDLEATDLIVDGWFGGAIRSPLTSGEAQGQLAVAEYHEATPRDNPFAAHRGLLGSPVALCYTSYRHVIGHVMASYCTSPFARRGQAAAVLVWDGGMLPRLYQVDPNVSQVRALGPINSLWGSLFVAIAIRTPPFRSLTEFLDERTKDDLLPVAGKVMAYAGLGNVDDEIISLLRELESTQIEVGFRGADAFSKTLATSGLLERRPEDALASLQAYLGTRLEESLVRALGRSADQDWTKRLCLGGGCALNIKWNSRLRASGRFLDVWVPPFPNDAGSAIGAAATAMAHRWDLWHLEWDVRRGPKLGERPFPPGWSGVECGADDLAALLHRESEPVVVLYGNAEIGPRALGSRSILAPATASDMKARLNAIKGREWYRPVAPICLEEAAPEIFDPGTRDPFMLFDHRVRPSWRERVPAIVHVDGTARLQTVSEREDPLMVEVLRAYARRSGVPLLCNTSANLSGRGFFPDASSAMEWGRARYVWAEGRLYEKCQ